MSASVDELAIVTVDAFTRVPFAGNPAAVCVLDETLSDELQQKLAAEMALSETAFVRVLDRATGRCALRWFTPTNEVNLCGHATLATAHALLEGGHVDDSVDELSFDTLSGELRVARVADGALRLDLPLGAPDEALGASIDTAPLFAALGVAEPAPRVESVAFCARTRKLLVEVASVGTVLAARSDPAALLALRWPAGCDVRGVILTARTTDDDERAAHDDALIVSRYFAPWNGIPEDPVTGSAHTVLAAFFAPSLGSTFRARQASTRGGTLTLSLEGAPSDRVYISGHAVSVLSGTIKLK